MTAATLPGSPRIRTVLVAHPSAELYGSDRVLLESVSALTGRGHRVVVTLPVRGPLVAHLEERGARVVIAPSPVLRKSALRPRGMIALLREAFRGTVVGLALLRKVRPHAVLVNTLTVPLWVLLARLRGVPVLVHVHEGESTASALARRVLAFPLLVANRVIANSRFSVDVLSSAFPRLASTQVVYNGVPGPDSPQEARESLDGAMRVVYLGRLSARKGVDVAVDAVALLVGRGVPATLTLVGAVYPGYEWYEKQLRAQVLELGLEGVVAFAGFRPSVWDEVAAADVVVVPSRVDEPFGNTAVEAVLAGRPVIASATSGLVEATAGYESAQTVVPGDPAALADALLAVHTEWNRMRAAAWADRSRAIDKHGPEVYRASIARLVEEMTGRGRRRQDP